MVKQIEKQMIQNWLAEEGFFRKSIHDDNANFHFIINYPDEHALDIIQPKGKEDIIVIGCATEIAPEQIAMIQGAKRSVKQNFIWDIRFGLNNFLLDFELEHPNDELQRFIITDEIYSDGLTKNSLISAIKKVFKGKLHCIWLIGKTFSGDVSSEDLRPDNSMFV